MTWDTRFACRTAALAACCIILTVPRPSEAGTVATLAASMSPGTFAEVTSMGGFDNGLVLVPLDLGCTVSDYITQFADKAAWDPVGDRVLFVGSTHGNCYAGRFVVYAETTNSWSVGAYPPGICQSGTSTNPCFSHGYSHSTADPSNGDFYYRHYQSGRIYRYRGGSWSQMASLPTSSLQCCGALEFFPDLGRMIFVDGDWGVWSYNPGANSWTLVANTNGAGPSGLPNLPMSAYNNFAVYDRVDRVLFFGGGGNIYKMTASGSITSVRSAPVSLGVTHSVVAADPVSGDLLVLSGSNMYQYDVAGDAWAALPAAVPAPLRGMNGVGDGLLQVPISEHGVVMYIKYNFTNSKVYLYKHAPFTAVAPNAPGALTVN
jgi:hypothetical protein